MQSFVSNYSVKLSVHVDTGQFLCVVYPGFPWNKRQENAKVHENVNTIEKYVIWNEIQDKVNSM